MNAQPLQVVLLKALIVTTALGDCSNSAVSSLLQYINRRALLAPQLECVV
jgi:hypothetical protein